MASVIIPEISSVVLTTEWQVSGKLLCKAQLQSTARFLQDHPVSNLLWDHVYAPSHGTHTGANKQTNKNFRAPEGKFVNNNSLFSLIYKDIRYKQDMAHRQSWNTHTGNTMHMGSVCQRSISTMWMLHKTQPQWYLWPHAQVTVIKSAAFKPLEISWGWNSCRFTY